jgi:phosphoglycerol transferase MdoB-like AlkP superfamily enzyme
VPTATYVAWLVMAAILFTGAVWYWRVGGAATPGRRRLASLVFVAAFAAISFANSVWLARIEDPSADLASWPIARTAIVSSVVSAVLAAMIAISGATLVRWIKGRQAGPDAGPV